MLTGTTEGLYVMARVLGQFRVPTEPSPAVTNNSDGYM